MPRINKYITNFSGGEISEKTRSRNDLDIVNNSMEWVQNFIPETQGPIKYRNGFGFVNHTRLNQEAVLLKFQFNSDQTYYLEFTDEYLRFHNPDGTVVEADKDITGASVASEVVIDCVGHGYTDGDEIYISGIVGMELLNNRFYLISDQTTDAFKLTDIDGNYVDTSAYDAYVSGGAAKKIYEIATHFTEAADLELIRYGQNADVVYLVHPSFRPAKLSRVGSTSWTFDNTYTITSPTGYNFSTTDFPGAVCFHNKRLIFTKVSTHPPKVFGSMAPTALGVTQYDDFTLGTAADDAFIFTLQTSNGRVDNIRWVKSMRTYLMVGTFATVTGLRGSQSDEPLSAISVNADIFEELGVADVDPVKVNDILVYVQRNGLTLRSLEYEPISGGIASVDRNLVSDHITESGIKKIAYQLGRPDLVWVLRKDGVLLSLTFKAKEDVSGWARHYAPGTDATFLDIQSLAQSNKFDLVATVTERTINGGTRRYIEYLAIDGEIPKEIESYTGEDNKTADEANYLGEMFEWQKTLNRLDSSLIYDGRLRGVNALSSITLSGTSVHASTSVFVASDVGKYISEIYTGAGEDGGEALITAYTSGTLVTARIEKSFTTAVRLPSQWAFRANVIGGLDHLEGEEVTVLLDGGTTDNFTVSGTTISLGDIYPNYAIVGLGYRGIIKTINLDAGSLKTGGSTQLKDRIIPEVRVRFYQSLGPKVGVSLYNLQDIIRTREPNYLNRPPALIDTPIEIKPMIDEDSTEKHLYIVQEKPLPCVVQGLDVYVEIDSE